MATAGDVAAPSQMEQSVDVNGGRSQLVRSESQPGASLGSSLSNRDARASFGEAAQRRRCLLGRTRADGGSCSLLPADRA